MFSSSKRILQSKRLLEAVSYKANSVSYLHSCNRLRILNVNRIVKLSDIKDQRVSVINLNSIYGTRLISTNVEDTIDTASTDAIERISNVESNKPASNSSQTVQSASTVDQSAAQETIQPDVAGVSEFPIPEAPTPPVKVLETVDGVVTHLGADPPFVHLGLGGWTPVGLIEHGFEFLHASLGLPWWECIIVATVTARVLLFPILVISQRNAARFSNNYPRFQELQEKSNEAKQRGENIEAARYTQDLMLFMKEKNINPLKNAMVPLIQAPVFISFFLGLREMANLPVKSMHNEGLFWFTDLTAPDQFYLLPIITSLTMLASIEVGAETGKMTSPNHYIVKHILRFMPLAVFPFTVNFPGAILIYWVTTNTVSLIVAGAFKVHRFRRFCKIEDKIIHSADQMDTKNPGLIKGIKKWWRETRTQGALDERSRKHRVSFATAGRGAVPKTYQYNPTIPRTREPRNAADIQAKKFS